MNNELARALREGQGLVTRRRALAAGVPPEHLHRWLKEGSWVAVRRAVYAERATVAAATTRAARQLLVDRAACLQISVPHVRSHESAALELGMDVLLPDPALTHVTRPGLQGSRNRHGVVHHLAAYLPEEQVAVAASGARVLDQVRTAIDIARYTGLDHGVVAVDAAMACGRAREEFRVALEVKRSWPGVTAAREAVELADPGSESVGETLARLLVGRLGFGRPETQFGLTDGLTTAWADLRLGRHLFEFDGRVKYHRAADGLTSEDVVWREKRRQDWLCGFKLGMSRIVWADLLGPARDAAAVRLRREYLDTVARFGDRIDDLSPYRARPRRSADDWAA